MTGFVSSLGAGGAKPPALFQFESNSGPAWLGSSGRGRTGLVQAPGGVRLGCENRFNRAGVKLGQRDLVNEGQGNGTSAMRDRDEVFRKLQQSPFRSRFRLNPKDRRYLEERG